MQVPIWVTRNGEQVSALMAAVRSVLLVGRHSECNLRLDGDLVSRNHARLVLGPTSFFVEDLSSNGTLLGTDFLLRGGRQELEYGATITVGPFEIIIGQGAGNIIGARPAPTTGRASLPPPAMPPAAPTGRASMPAPAMPPAAPTGRVNLGTIPPPAAAAVQNAPVPGPTMPPPAPAPAVAEAVSPHRNVALRRRIHAELLKNLDLAKIDATRAADDPSLRPRVLTALKRILRDLGDEIPPSINQADFIGELAEEALGLGPLEPLLADGTVTEIMVVDPMTIYVERNGRLELTSAVFTDDERVRAVIERIVTPLGRRIDESQPVVDARLKDGSRVNAVIRPLALRGTNITIRKFPKRRLEASDLISIGSMTDRMARFLHMCVVAKKNILISGGTGSGKTTLLNILSASVPTEERIVTIEDAAELRLHQPHVVPLETKVANMEGKGAFTIRELVRNALRMRPDRIIVGECRGGEALDMLQAMNTGHDGSLTTIHSNSPIEALARLETLVLMAGLDLPSRAIREQIARCIHVIVQQSRMSDGSRKITHISEVEELDSSGVLAVRHLFEFDRTGVAPDGTVIGDFDATGYLPSFTHELIARGLLKNGESLL